MPATRDSNGNTICVNQFVIDNQLICAETALHAAELYVGSTYCHGMAEDPAGRLSPPERVVVREVGQPIQITMTYEMKCTAEFKNEAVVAMTTRVDLGVDGQLPGLSNKPKKPPMKPDPIPAGLKPTLSDD